MSAQRQAHRLDNLEKAFSLLQSVQTNSAAPPNLYSTDTRDVFVGVKAAVACS